MPIDIATAIACLGKGDHDLPLKRKPGAKSRSNCNDQQTNEYQDHTQAAVMIATMIAITVYAEVPTVKFGSLSHPSFGLRYFTLTKYPSSLNDPDQEHELSSIGVRLGSQLGVVLCEIVC